MHALIIEQDLWVVLMIEDVLGELGYVSFAHASSPETAIASARKCCPDLVTSDLRLDSGNGLAAVRQICSGKAIPVVFVTATPWEVRKADPDATIVPKPFGAETLKAGVARATIAA